MGPILPALSLLGYRAVVLGILELQVSDRLLSVSGAGACSSGSSLKAQAYLQESFVLAYRFFVVVLCMCILFIHTYMSMYLCMHVCMYIVYIHI